MKLMKAGPQKAPDPEMDQPKAPAPVVAPERAVNGQQR